MAGLPLACDVIECPAGLGMDRSLAGEALPAPKAARSNVLLNRRTCCCPYPADPEANPPLFVDVEPKSRLWADSHDSGARRRTVLTGFIMGLVGRAAEGDWGSSPDLLSL